MKSNQTDRMVVLVFNFDPGNASLGAVQGQEEECLCVDGKGHLENELWSTVIGIQSVRRWSFRALSRQLYSIRETGQKEDYKWKQFHGDCVRLSRWTGIVSDNQNMFQMVMIMNKGFPCSGNQFIISCVFISSYVAIVDASFNYRGKEFCFIFCFHF